MKREGANVAKGLEMKSKGKNCLVTMRTLGGYVLFAVMKVPMCLLYLMLRAWIWVSAWVVATWLGAPEIRKVLQDGYLSGVVDMMGISGIYPDRPTLQFVGRESAFLRGKFL